MSGITQRNRYTKQRQKGIGVIECVVATVFIIPIVLFCIDVLALVLSQSVNEHLAFDAARAAADQDTPEHAQQAAIDKILSMKTSGLIHQIILEDVSYTKQSVTVRTSIRINMPAPFPSFSSLRLSTNATEPVVGIPANF